MLFTRVFTLWGAEGKKPCWMIRRSVSEMRFPATSRISVEKVRASRTVPSTMATTKLTASSRAGWNRRSMLMGLLLS